MIPTRLAQRDPGLPNRPQPAAPIPMDWGCADVAPFIGLTGSLRYGRLRHHLGAHWQDRDHE
jgi:hypothetical protein